MHNRRLSRSCNLEDFVISETAMRHGLDNWPKDEAVIARLQLLAEKILEPVGEQFQTRPMISSGYRASDVNARVGGTPTSQHVNGEAVDFQMPGISELEVARWMAGALDFDQLILEKVDRPEGAVVWIHCSYVSPEKNRKQVKHGGSKGFADGLPETWP